jgi:hypothetical protein
MAPPGGTVRPMRWRLSIVYTTALGLGLGAGGCFPPGATDDADGGSSGAFSAPTLEVTVSGVHFGPTVPDPGAFADLVVTRDGGGKPTSSSFRMSGTIGSAGCMLAFDRYGGGVPLAVGQYTVQSMQGASTLDGTVYPTTGERILTPEGGAQCAGSSCDGAAFVLSAVDATHASGYFQGTVDADSGAGQASVVCTFWLPMRMYSP